jgi:hypothetical protein
MAETPDFDQLARAIVDDDAHELPFAQAIAEQLRKVWNARGAADRLAVADLLVSHPSNIIRPVQDAIRKQDRR